MYILANTFVIIPSSPSSPIDGQLIVDPTTGLLGIYDSGLLKDSKEISIDTPYGKTSDSITVGEFNGKKVVTFVRKFEKF